MEHQGVSDENFLEDLTSQDNIDTTNASEFGLDRGSLICVTWNGPTFKVLGKTTLIMWVRSMICALQRLMVITADLQKTMNIEDMQHKCYSYKRCSF